MNVFKRMSTVIILATLCVFANHVHSESLFEMIVDTITIEDAEIRTEGLAAIKKNKAVTDDDYSLLMIKAAEEFKKDEYRFIRGFAMGALMRFGASNALDYVWNEALHGPDQTGGFKAYALISSFNDETFSLANALYFREDKISQDRRISLYSFLDTVANSEYEYCCRRITPENRRRILAFLHEKMNEEHSDPKYLDGILLRSDPEYGNSDERKRIIASLVESVPTNLPTYAYFRDEYTKLLNSGKEQKEGLSPNGASREAEPTQPDEGFWEESKSMALPALAGLVGVAAAVAYLLKRKGR